MAIGAIPVTPATPQMPAPFTGQGPAGGPTIGKAVGGVATISPYYQGLSAQFANWLAQQTGKGATPFNGSQTMPSTGTDTTPGQLSADMTPILQQLQDFFTGKGGGVSAVPGLTGLNEMSQTGNPVTTLPAWQKSIEAMRQNTEQNAANLKEQFAGSGTLHGSAYGDAASKFSQQTTRDQNALLAGSEAQALESAQGRKLTSQQTLFQGAQQLGQLFQGMDQAAIDRTLQEFIRTRPEYSPLLPMLQQLTTMFGPTTGKTASPSVLQQVMGGIGTLVGAATGIKGLLPTGGTPINANGPGY